MANNRDKGRMIPNYRAFAEAVMKKTFDGYDFDGGYLQDLALKHGIIRKTKYDPKIHGENSCDCEPGDDWFEFMLEPNVVGDLTNEPKGKFLNGRFS